MLIYPQVNEIYPIGSMIQSQAPPNNKWIRCYGQILSISEYPALYNIMRNPHSLRWNNWYPFELSAGGQMYVNILTDGTNYVLTGTYSTLAYSTDLVNWTHITPVSGSWYAGVYGNGTFVVAGYNSNAAAISVDGGQSWTAKTLPQTKYWYYACWDGTYFFVAASNYNKLCRSTDGNSWAEIDGVTTATSGYLGYNGLASDGNGTLIAIHNAAALGISYDHGATWSVRPMSAGGTSPEGIQYINGKFVLNFWDGHLAYSEDGVDWVFTQNQIIDAPFFYNIPRQDALSKWIYGNGMYLGIGGLSSSTVFFLYSYDLKTFDVIFRNLGDEGYYLYDAIWDAANDRWFMLCGNGGMAFYLTEFGYDENTYFQLPYTGGDLKMERGKQWYIRVR